jgi:hypothetical protein
MTVFRTLVCSPFAALRLAGAVAVLAASAPTVAAADCFSIGQQVAAQNGGTLARATPATQDGQPVCRIVVLLPAKEGERPRRAEFVVPQN